MTLAERVSEMVTTVNELFALKSRNCVMRDRYRAVSAAAAEATVSGSPIEQSRALHRLHVLAQALRDDRYIFRGKGRRKA